MAGKEDGERDDLCDDHVTNMAVCGYLNEFKMKRLNFGFRDITQFKFPFI